MAGKRKREEFCSSNVAEGWSAAAPETLYETPYFTLCAHQVVNPKQVESRYYYLDSGDWVKIVPVTKSREVILVNQYRPSVKSYSLEVPGGVVDASDLDPLSAARRELLEETGFTSGDIRSLGWAYANPGIQTTRCYFFVAYDVERTAPPQPEHTECLEVLQLPLTEIPALITTNRITHSLVLLALLRLLQPG